MSYPYPQPSATLPAYPFQDRLLPLVLNTWVTPTPVPTPTSHPMTLPQTVFVKSSSVWRPEYSSYTRVAGEVMNNIDKTAWPVNVSVTFCSSAGQVAGSGSSYGYGDSAPPGWRVPFKLLLETAEDWTSYRFGLTYGLYDTSPVAGCTEKRNYRGYWSGSRCHVVGEILNICDRGLTSLEVVATFYDSAGRVINADSAYANPSSVPVGGTASFDVSPSDGSRI